MAKTIIENKWRVILNAILIIASLVAVLSIGIYIYKFNSFHLSNTVADWGVFGDYIGGTLNPVLSIINICITIWIAIILNNISQAANESQLNNQKEITLMQIKYDAIKELNELLNNQFNKWSADLKSKDKINDCLKKLTDFEITYGELFEITKISYYGSFKKSLTESEIGARELDIDKMRQLFKAAETHKMALLYALGKTIATA